MYEPVQKCTHCGAGLTLDDLRGSSCKYCGTVFPHRAQAEQHAQLAGQIMNQMIAQQSQIQNQWRAGFGAPPVPMMPPPPGAPGSPYADPARIAAAHMAQTARMSGMIAFFIAGAVVAVLALVGAIVFFAMMR